LKKTLDIYIYIYATMMLTLAVVAFIARKEEVSQMKKLTENCKRLQIKGFAIGGIMALLLSGIVIVEANEVRNSILVHYGVNIAINGTLQSFPQDMTPFISEGRTFLPVRGISEALGVLVEWDGVTQTVYIGAKATGTPLLEAVPWHEQHAMGVEAATILGNSYQNVMVPRADMTFSSHNLNGQFELIRGTIGRVDESGTGNGFIRFIGDGHMLAYFTIGTYATPEDISIDVRGVNTLRIEMDRPRGIVTASGSRPALINPKIYSANIPVHVEIEPARSGSPLFLAANFLGHSPHLGVENNIANAALVRDDASILGVTHRDVYRHFGNSNALGFRMNGWRQYALNMQFHTLTGTLGRIDGSGEVAATVTFYGDGRQLAYFEVDGNTRPHDISVDVSGVIVLEMRISRPRGGTIGFGPPAPASPAFFNAVIE